MSVRIRQHQARPKLGTINARSGLTTVILSNLDPASAEKPIALVRGWLQQIKQ